MMKLISEHSGESGPTFCCDERSILFDTDKMLPQMLINDEPPSVFYFAPVHFADKTFGYSVLQRDLSESRKLNLVYRNWLRLVNNSLEMMRAKNRYIVLSTHDEMTGLLNRRGFYDELEKAAHDNETSKMDVVILSIDLDGLKKINDTYGHSEGDSAIITVGRAISAACGSNAICARFGGDEFAAAAFVVANSADSWFDSFIRAFHDIIEEYNRTSKKPYLVIASIGYASHPYSKSLKLEALINKADSLMYADKATHKNARQTSF
jgi:diguanylate cyclase (GGDEF)-like protein